ncbi:hypothetical protein [Rhizobium acaciae]|uniref:hypothetical protein n=1 Tax=Rhizobium acaciae TaxID=2989736 RepID=UPI0029CA908D|nr:hypothetical protein [Rhizobium acaciae]
MHFGDACASLWIDGELVHLEDLVLHDAHADIRMPSHELTIARDVLRTRRRIAAHPPGWALSPAGLQSLRRQEADIAADGGKSDGVVSTVRSTALLETAGGGEVHSSTAEHDDPPSVQLADIDALLAHSEAVIAEAKAPGRNGEGENEELDHDRRPETYLTGGSILGGNAGSVLSGNQHHVGLVSPGSASACKRPGHCYSSPDPLLSCIWHLDVARCRAGVASISW